MYNKMKNFIKTKKEGSALLLSLLLITSIIVIAMGGSSLALSGIRMAGVQSQSVKAYFAAEAGAEELLYKVRQSEEIDLSDDTGTEVIQNGELDTNSEFFVILSERPPEDDEYIFISIGTFLNTRRSVDLRF